MKVLLLNPPAVDNVKIVREGRCMQRQEAWGTSWAPLTLAIMASILRDAGFTVDLKDCSNDGISFEGLKGIIKEFRPELIVANTSTPSITGDLKVAGLAKEVDENTKTIFFGIHVTALPEETFKENSDVEFIASGEPEYTVRDFALALKNKLSLSGVKGLVHKSGGVVIYNEKRPLIVNLDELPDPAWDLVNIPGYRLPITQRPFLLILTGRGCPYPCTFCAAGTFYGKKTRLRSPARIVSEMKRVKEKYGIKDFLFWSENAICERKQIYDISRSLVEDALGIKWVCNGRVDMIDEELLKMMKRAGCWMIGYGIEAGTEKVLRLMKKNIKIDDMRRAVTLTKKAGIEVTGHVIVGFPGETKEDILETAKMTKRLDFDYIQIYCSVPFPGSALYEEARKKGFIKSNDWAMFEQNFSVMDTPWLLASEVMAERERMIRDFYLDPRKIFKTLRKIRSPREVLFFIKFAARYFAAWAKLPQTKEIENLDGPRTALLHRDIIRSKPFLKRIYTDFYNRFKKAVKGFPDGALFVELGSGGGFIKDVMPGVVTSDIVDLEGVDRHFSALNMPLKDASVDAFFMIDVLHHVNDAARFFREVSRCLRPGGKIIMIEPANTLWSRFVHRNFHHEPFDTAGGWTVGKSGALSGANTALAWIIFYRDRQKFENKFPDLKITQLENHTPLRYIVSGGLSFRQLLPSFTYNVIKGVESLISPFNGCLGMFLTVQVEKIK